MTYKWVQFYKEGPVATVVLDAPGSLNAMNEPLLLDLCAALDRCAFDDEIRVLVLRGEGKAFCAGGDVREMGDGLEEGDTHRLARGVRGAGMAALKIRGLMKPVIASMHGSAAGAGWSLALLCDFRVVSEEVRLVEAFAGLGLVPDMGGTYVLSRYLGMGRLTEFLMTGGVIDARRALALGLVNAVVRREDLIMETTTLAHKLAAMSRGGLAKSKSLINQTLFMNLAQALLQEEEYQDELSRGADYREAIAAFLENRKPNFS